jgi:exodeoxyribonuclease VII large subunit
VLQAMADVRAGARGRLATARAQASSVAAQVAADAATAVRDARTRSGALFEEIRRVARNTLRWGADAAEGTFREVVAQGPEKTLGRGFAVVHSATGQIVTSAAAASEAAEVRLQFQDGSIDASVRRGEEKKP